MAWYWWLPNDALRGKSSALVQNCITMSRLYVSDMCMV
jgi:hypothetical protein